MSEIDKEKTLEACEATKEQFVDFFNSISMQIENDKANTNVPAFRLYKDKNICDSEEELTILEGLLKNLKTINSLNYNVEVVENLEVLDVNRQSRYFVRITNNNSAVSYEFDVNTFRDNLLDYDYDPDAFILDVLKKIEGTSADKQMIDLKDSILEYLSYAIHYKQALRYEYSTIGWDRYSVDNRTRIFKYDCIYSRNENIKGKLVSDRIDELSMSEPSLLQDSKEDRWMHFTISLMNNHVYDSLIFACGISGLIRQILTFTKETNINVNINGESGSGKSTIGHYVLSFFGNPITLEGASIDTANAEESIRLRRSVLPYVLDERLLRYFADSDKKQQSELLLEVFREYEGKEKERLGSSKKTSANRIYGPIISSSVDSLLDKLLAVKKDLGQYRRMIEFYIGKADDKVLFNEAEAIEAENISNSCYGYGVRYVVQYMLYRLETNDDYFEERYKELVETIRKRMKEENNCSTHGLTSSAMRFALITLSYQVLREAFYYQVSDYLSGIKSDDEVNTSNVDVDTVIKNMDEVIEDKTDEIISILINNLVLKMERVQKSGNSRGLLDYIINSIHNYPEFFCKDITDYPASKNIAAEYDEEGYKCIEFISNNHLEVALMGKKIPDIKIIMEANDKSASGMKELYKTCFGEQYAKSIDLDGVVVDKNPHRKKSFLTQNENGEKVKEQKRTTIIKIPIIVVNKDDEEE